MADFAAEKQRRAERLKQITAGPLISKQGEYQVSVGLEQVFICSSVIKTYAVLHRPTPEMLFLRHNSKRSHAPESKI